VYLAIITPSALDAKEPDAFEPAGDSRGVEEDRQRPP
jgi:hypothetical protein